MLVRVRFLIRGGYLHKGFKKASVIEVGLVPNMSKVDCATRLKELRANGLGSGCSTRRYSLLLQNFLGNSKILQIGSCKVDYVPDDIILNMLTRL